MRCRACDTLLAETELLRKDTETGEFMDLCGTCSPIVSSAKLALDEWITVISEDRKGTKHR